MEYIYAPRYVKQFDALSVPHQQLALDADAEIRRYYHTGEAFFGLRIKRLHTGAHGKVFEARVSLALRMLWLQHGQQVTFVFLGTHDEVRRFLRSW